MHFLYASHVRDEHMTPDQRAFLQGLGAGRCAISDGAQAPSHQPRRKDISTAQDWVSAFFDKGAEEVLGYYADDFVWEDIEFMQTITTKEELYKAFIVFNNSGPDSPFGVHKFEVLSYDGDRTPVQHAQTRDANGAGLFPAEVYARYADNISLGADFEYDEWGYMQWIWKATHNAPFFGIEEAVGKTTYTRGTTTQFYREGKIVRCRTHWNFREFAMQIGIIPLPDEAWRDNPSMPTG